MGSSPISGDYVLLNYKKQCNIKCAKVHKFVAAWKEHYGGLCGTHGVNLIKCPFLAYNGVNLIKCPFLAYNFTRVAF